MGNAVAVTGLNFDTEVLQSKEPVLVDFWAEWCGPCRLIAPVVEEIATEFRGRLKVVKLDVESAPEIATRFGVLGIPTLLVFKNGEQVERLVGNYPKPIILSKVKAHIAA